jgi:hypothetical protein
MPRPWLAANHLMGRMTLPTTAAARFQAVAGRLAKTPIYGPLFASAFMLTVFEEAGAPIEALTRPLVVALATSAFVQVLLGPLVRDHLLGAWLALIALVGLVSPAGAVTLAAIVAVPILVRYLLTRTRLAIPWPRLASTANAVSAALFLVAVVGVASGGALDPSPTRPAKGPASSSRDIVFILLDGYPRADTLASSFEFDNGPFLDQMAAVGFDVAARSQSNYNTTLLSLASMMSATHVDALMPEPPTDLTAQVRSLGRLVAEGTELEAARSAGYEIVTIPSPFTGVTLRGADRVIDVGAVTEFELAVLQATVLPLLLPEWFGPWLADVHRSGIHRAFAELGQLADEPRKSPRLVFAHMIVPHPPYLFAADGDPVDPWPCFPTTCTLWDAGYAYGDANHARAVAQIQYINELTLEVAQRWASAGNAAVIVFSDHGQRLDLADEDEMLANLTLSYTPDRPGLFSDDVTPVNMIPVLLNTYAGLALPLTSNQSYLTDLRLTHVGGYFPLKRALEGTP